MIKHEALKPAMQYVYAYRCSCGAHFAYPQKLERHIEIEKEKANVRYPGV